MPRRQKRTQQTEWLKRWTWPFDLYHTGQIVLLRQLQGSEL